MIYEIAKADKSAALWKMRAARAAIAAGLALIFAGVTFAGQAGIGIASRLADHQHTGAGDGAILQGLAPVGNFDIAGNNAGNIGISTFATGSHFIWKPASTTFLAGQATDDSFYVNNIGGYSWIGGYNTMSRGDYSLAFGTYVKNYRAASILGGYYLQNNAGNSIMFGSGPGFGPNAYAINNDTGSIKFFPLTTTSETRPMLNLKRDNTAEAVGVWNFVSSPTINGVALSTAIGVDNTKVLKTGDTMTGQLTLAGSTLTVTGNAFSVGGSTLNISNGIVRLNAATSDYSNEIGGTGIAIGNNTGVYFRDTGATARAMLGMFGGNYLQIAPQGAFNTGINPNGGRVGIGTGAPYSALLDVRGNIATSGQIISSGTGNNYFAGDINKANSAGTVYRTYTNGERDGAIITSYYMSGDDYLGTLDIVATRGSSDAQGGSSIRFLTQPRLSAGVPTTRMKIDQNGNVGISTTSPSERLEVVGGFRTPKNKISPEGGFLVLAYNDSGVSVASGTIVNSTGSATDYGFKVNPIGGAQSWGAVYGSTGTTTMGACAAGTWCWICSGGLCGVNVDASGCATRGLWVGASNTTAGTAECIAEPAGVGQHDREIGHNVIATPAGGQAWIMSQFGR